MKNKRYIFSMLCMVFILCLALASAHADITTTIQSASEYDYPPFSIVTKDGNADGFSVELLRAALRAVHLDVEFKVGPWAEIKNELAEGKLQVLPLVARTPERESIYDFTFHYLTLHGAIFVRKGDTRIETVDDLADKEIIVMKGDISDEHAKREHISPHIIAVESYEGAMRLLASGKRDAVIAQRLMGIQLLKNLGISGIVPLEYKLEKFKQNFSFAVREGDKELLALLNEGLSIVMVDGTFERLHDKWFTPILGHRLLPKEMFKYGLIIGIPIIVFILLAFILILRRKVKRKTDGLRLEIEERKKTEEELNKSEGQYRLLFTSSPYGWAYHKIILDETNKPIDYIFLEINDAFEDLTGLRREDIINKRATEALPGIEKDPVDWIGRYGEVAQTGKVIKFENYNEFIGKWYAVTAFSSSKGYFIVVFDDITDRKKAEDQIKASLKEKEVLLQEIHHRVKNNFTVIMSLLSLQSANIKDEGVKAIFRDSSNRLKSMSLVHDMLYRAEDLTHIDFGNYVHQLTQYTFRTYKVTSDKIRINVDIKDIYLNTDTSILIGMIVNELVSNAMEYGFPGDRRGEIWIAMKKIDSQQGDEYEIIVKDNGVGLPEGLDIHKSDTLGLRMVTNMVERQLSGSIEVKTDGGTEHKLRCKELVYKKRI